MALWLSDKRVGALYVGKKAVGTMWLGAIKIYEAVSSCFGSGLWRSAMPWKGSDAWRNTK